MRCRRVSLRLGSSCPRLRAFRSSLNGIDTHECATHIARLHDALDLGLSLRLGASLAFTSASRCIVAALLVLMLVFLGCRTVMRRRAFNTEQRPSFSNLDFFLGCDVVLFGKLAGAGFGCTCCCCCRSRGRCCFSFRLCCVTEEDWIMWRGVLPWC